MIISCSRRTDIPALFVPWFMNRIEAGYCSVANPKNPKQVTHVSLKVCDVDAIVFWTKNPAPLIPRLPELSDKGYRYYFQYTLTGYGQELEPRVPSIPVVVENFENLAKLIGPQRVIWRYDPILVCPEKGFEYHISRFREIASLLKGKTNRVVISILDLYGKTLKNLGRSAQVEERPEHLVGFGSAIETIASIAAENDMEIQSCAETIDLRPYGISQGKCIDNALLETLFGFPFVASKDPTQRKICGCVKSQDIGVYDTCNHGCKYCYATNVLGENSKVGEHDPLSPSLVGWFDSSPNIG